jgi:lysozyme family protein
MSISLNPQLTTEYESLFGSCLINPAKQNEAVKIKNKIVANKSVYELVENATRVPWFVVAVIHSLEG